MLRRDDLPSVRRSYANARSRSRDRNGNVTNHEGRQPLRFAGARETQRVQRLWFERYFNSLLVRAAEHEHDPGADVLALERGEAHLRRDPAQARAERRGVEIAVLERGLRLPVRRDEEEERRLPPRVRGGDRILQRLLDARVEARTAARDDRLHEGGVEPLRRLRGGRRRSRWRGGDRHGWCGRRCGGWRRDRKS